MLKKIFTQRRNFHRSRRHARQRGGVLIGAVIVMVVMGVLGAGMVAMLGSTAVQEVRANYGERAYYLAESGYRFAESTRLKDSVAFWELDHHSIVVDDPDVGGKFTINLVKLMKEDGGEYDDTAEVDGGPQNVIIDPLDADYRPYLDVKGPDPNVDFKLPSRFGLFRHQGSWYRYNGCVNADDNTARLSRVLSVDTNRKVDGPQEIESGVNVNLTITGGPAIALSDGKFRRGTDWFEYDSFSDNTLYNVTPDGTFTDGEALTFPSKFPLDATDGDEIVLAPMVRIISTGEYPGSGLLNATRTLHYEQIAYQLPTYTGGEPPADSFDPGDEIWSKPNDPNEWDPDDWVAGPGTTGEGDVLGDYIVEEIDGSDALHLDSMNPSEVAQPSTMVMFQAEQITNAAYQAQIKIKLSGDLNDQADELTDLYDEDECDCPYYVAGITFRKVTDNLSPGGTNVRSYGISFLRGKETNRDNVNSRLIPNQIIPSDDTPYIVLWKYEKTANTQSPAELLAYAPLTGSNIIDSDGLVKPWSTLLVRVEQLGEEGAYYNRILAMYGHADPLVNTGNNQQFDQTRLSSPRNGLTAEEGDNYLPWPPNDVLNDWVSENDYFTVVQWTAVAGSGATVPDNYSAVYVHTAEDEYLFQEGNDLEVGLHSWGHNLDGMLWFDDFGILQAAPAVDGNEEFPNVFPVIY
ncbi:MAG TPA: hypothetical protein PK489_14200 [Prolixibacteraceae bacterium]|nr:hypothetical protein [Prolixibacteraceae bacterium]